jgi:hypothetical protein
MRDPMNPSGSPKRLLLLGVGAGAVLSYFLDPDRGSRRRALARDRMVAMLHDTQEALGKVGRDSRNRARGLSAMVDSLRHRESPPDPQLVERVRSRMGRFVSHPRAIEVTAQDGIVHLQGPILREEKDRLVTAVHAVPGVREVVDRLEAHDAAEGVPALQGGKEPGGAPFELAQDHWAPAPRFLVGTLASALMAYGLRKRGRGGISTALLGSGLLARSLLNAPVATILAGSRRSR